MLVIYALLLDHLLLLDSSLLLNRLLIGLAASQSFADVA
jgi:hypothetical protein